MLRAPPILSDRRHILFVVVPAVSLVAKKKLHKCNIENWVSNVGETKNDLLANAKYCNEDSEGVHMSRTKGQMRKQESQNKQKEQHVAE